MSTETFFITILEFDGGYDQYNLGDNWSFLFNEKWYPTRAFVKRYLENIGDPRANDINLHTAVYLLSKAIPIYSKKVRFNVHQPVSF